MKKTYSISESSRALNSSQVTPSKLQAAVKRLMKPAIPLAVLLSSQAVYATCEYNLVDEWGSGFRAEVSITNNTPSTFNDWAVSFAWSDGTTLKNGWSGTYDCSGSSCNVTGPSWAPNVDSNQTFTFGFIGQKAVNGAPAQTSVTIAGEVCGVASTPVEPVTPIEIDTPTEQPNVLWTLDGTQSNVQYVSTRLRNPGEEDGEVNTFEAGDDGLSPYAGSIDRSGNAVLSIDLNDVQTGNTTREGRIFTYLFESEFLPTAYISVDLDADDLASVAVGTSQIKTITGDLTLHALTQEVEAEVLIARTSATDLIVSTTQPIRIDSNDFELDNGIEILRGLAGLTTISETVPVYFNLHYVANTDANAAPLTLAAQPAQPGIVNADFRSSVPNLSVDWQDLSSNETSFVLRRRIVDGSWTSLAFVGQNVQTYIDPLNQLAVGGDPAEPIESGDYEYKVIAINNGIPSDSSESNVATIDIDVVETPDVEPTPEPTPDPEPTLAPVPAPDDGNTDPIGNFASGAEIYQNQCIFCHSASGEGAGPFPAINVPTERVGSFEALAAYIVEFMPLGEADECLEECSNDVSRYIVDEFYPNGADAFDAFNDDVVIDEPAPAPTPEPTPELSACLADDDEIHYGARQLKILTGTEYQNSVEDLVGVNFNVSEGLSADAQVGLFANNTHSSIVASSYSNFLLVAAEVAEWSSSENFASTGLNCGNNIDQNCASRFMNDLAPRIFRRPLTEEEVEIYEVMADGSSTNGDVQAGITLAMEAMLSSPQFLYRHELGEANPNNPDLDSDGFELTSYEMATFLAYTFTGSTPDQTLMQAAANGSLRTDAGIMAQATRLTELAEAQNVLGDFVGSWLGTDDLAIAAKDEQQFPNFPSLVPYMQNEVRANFSNAMLDSEGSFAAIYDSGSSYINGPLADHYGISGVSGDQFRRVSTPDRGGILVNGAFMARWGEFEESNPIIRGVRVRRRMLCQSGPDGLQDPPAGTFASREERLAELSDLLAAPTTTQRIEVAALTDGLPCSACHEQYINPLGFGMENFDTVGRIRQTDARGNDIDSSGTLFAANTFGNISDLVEFQGAQGLGSVMAASSTAQSCLSEQMFRYVIGVGHESIDEDNTQRTLAAEEIEGYACEVENLTQSLMDENPRAMLERFSTLDAVRFRKAWSRSN